MLSRSVKTLAPVILLVVIVGLAPGRSNPSDNSTSLTDLNHLLGTWTRATNSGHAGEEWMKVSEHTFEGLGYRTRDGEKTVTEFLRLEQFGSEIFYTAKPLQNPYPVAFKLISFEKETAIFANPHHDFPQKIIYTFKEGGSLHARIEGPQDGETVGIDFVFSKANN